MRFGSISLALLGSMTLFNIGCTSSSDSTAASSNPTSSISSVPKATGPVNGASASAMEAASSLAAKLSFKGAVHANSATTGVSLKAWNNSSLWTSSTSRAMCEVGSLMQDAFDGAMAPDKIACYVGAMHAAGKFGASTIDDGNYFYFKLSNLPGSASYQPRIKMKIIKTAGAITTFEMFSCFDNSTGTTQSEYLSSVIGTDGSATLTAKNVGSQGTASYGSQTSVTGTVDSTYKWNSKLITVSRNFSDSAYSAAFSQNASITQRTSSFLLNGYNKGSWGTGATKQLWTNKFYVGVQGLNMSTPKDIALGDGSAKFGMDFCIDPQGSSGTACNGSEMQKFNATGLDSWVGDTRAKLGTASSGDYYTEASAGTLPSSTPNVSVSFDSNQTWDCTASSFTALDMSDFGNAASAVGAAIAACDANYSFERTGGGSGYVCESAQ